MTVLELDNVSKRYMLGSSVRSVRDAFSDAVARLRAKSHASRRELWAVRNLSFKVEAGEVMGIVGPNGAGKSTLLKLISRITKPSTGTIRSRGRLSALIEVGAGFHPELSGRENIFLNASILGLNRREIMEKFDEIVAFSELEKFIDTPLKRYSSGMYVRLGFAVAAHMKPDVLLVDEVLAVGDASFQQKCIRRMRDLKENGASIIFVSHNMDLIAGLCPRTLLLWKGKLTALGPTDQVVSEYRRRIREIPASESVQDAVRGRLGSRDVEIVDARFIDADGAAKETFRTGEKLIIRIHYKATKKIENVCFSVVLWSLQRDRLCSYYSTRDGLEIPALQGSGYVDLEIEALNLLANTFTVSVGVWDHDGLVPHDHLRSMFRLEVHDTGQREGLVYLPHQWVHSPEGTTE